MPQTSDEVRKIIANWFPNTDVMSEDYQCWKLLIAKGWTEKGGHFAPPSPSYYGPREDYILLKYLVEEWDYDYECAPLIPSV